jgi:23S rRNA (pseudouridine1915-N3)-methyltransferase
MRLSLIAVGRLKRGPERELVERYRGRIDAIGRILGFSSLESLEIPESRASRESDRRAAEGRALLEKVGALTLVAFDERGKSLRSESFAATLQKWREGGRAGIACVIGGHDGLDPGICRRADLVVSFGALTLPHQLVRVLVAEQLYRALTMMAGHPYHRAGYDA